MVNLNWILPLEPAVVYLLCLFLSVATATSCFSDTKREKYQSLWEGVFLGWLVHRKTRLNCDFATLISGGIFVEILYPIQTYYKLGTLIIHYTDKFFYKYKSWTSIKRPPSLNGGWITFNRNITLFKTNTRRGQHYWSTVGRYLVPRTLISGIILKINPN